MYMMESVSVTLLLKQAWIHNTNKAQSVLEICAFVRLMNSLKYLVAILFSIIFDCYRGIYTGREWDGIKGAWSRFRSLRRRVKGRRYIMRICDSATACCVYTWLLGWFSIRIFSELSIEMTCNLWCLGKGLTRSQQRGEKIVLFTLSQIRRCVSDGEGEV